MTRPLSRISSFEQDIDRLFAEALRRVDRSLQPWGATCYLSAFEGVDGVTMELSGLDVDQSHLEVEARGNTLTVSSHRPLTSFTWAVHLPESVDPYQASARYSHGVVTVTIPRSAERTGRVIPIEGPTSLIGSTTLRSWWSGLCSKVKQWFRRK